MRKEGLPLTLRASIHRFNFSGWLGYHGAREIETCDRPPCRRFRHGSVGKPHSRDPRIESVTPQMRATATLYPDQRPRGSEAVRAALILAATELFAKFGPAEVSVREIAAHAHVNHGLVHRHFGSKEALLTAVLEQLTREMALDMAKNRKRRAARQAFRATRKQGVYLKILAHTLLEGRGPTEVQREFPVMNALVQAARAGQAQGRFDPKLDPRMLTAFAAALALGWMLFEPFLLESTGLIAIPPARRYREISRIWRRMEKAVGPRS